MRTTTDIGRADAAVPSTPRSSLWPGVMTVVAGAVFFDGALLTAVYRGSSSVSEDQLSFPWQGATALATSLIWGAAGALLVVGLVAFARTGAPAGGRGRAGARLAVAGGAVFVAAHGVSVFAYDASTDDAVAIVAMSLFGVGTLLQATGLLAAGVATLRSGVWSGWRQATPLALGVWMILMIPLQFTAALPVAVGVYALGIIALGVALLDATPATHRR